VSNLGATFTGSVTGTTLTVASLTSGSLDIGNNATQQYVYLTIPSPPGGSTTHTPWRITGGSGTSFTLDQTGSVTSTAMQASVLNCPYAIDGNATPATGSVAAATLLQDQAVLENGYNPTGTITFQLYDPANHVITTGGLPQTVTVTGNGVYTNAGYTLPPGALTGTYQWVVSYSGDVNNTAQATPVPPSVNLPQQVVVTP